MIAQKKGGKFQIRRPTETLTNPFLPLLPSHLFSLPFSFSFSLSPPTSLRNACTGAPTTPTPPSLPPSEDDKEEKEERAEVGKAWRRQMTPCPHSLPWESVSLMRACRETSGRTSTWKEGEREGGREGGRMGGGGQY